MGDSVIFDPEQARRTVLPRENEDFATRRMWFIHAVDELKSEIDFALDRIAESNYVDGGTIVYAAGDIAERNDGHRRDPQRQKAVAWIFAETDSSTDGSTSYEHLYVDEYRNVSVDPWSRKPAPRHFAELPVVPVFQHSTGGFNTHDIAPRVAYPLRLTALLRKFRQSGRVASLENREEFAIFEKYKSAVGDTYHIPNWNRRTQ